MRLRLLYALAIPLMVHGEQRWLPIFASNASAEQVTERIGKVGVAKDSVMVVASDDCRNLKPGLFLAVAGIAMDKAAAQEKVNQLKKTVGDAYLRVCEVKDRSRVQFGISAVDPSVFALPADAVNWSDEDRVSEIRHAGDNNILLRRFHQNDKDDPREGRRTAVVLFKSDPAGGQRLSTDCERANVVTGEGLLALTCATGNAGDTLLHSVTVFELPSGEAIRTVPRCRNPKVWSNREVACEAEDIGADGRLTLKSKRISVR